MLQGTFETLALSELLGLISHSRKTGALGLDAGHASAVLYVVDGRCCAAVSNDARRRDRGCADLARASRRRVLRGRARRRRLIPLRHGRAAVAVHRDRRPRGRETDELARLLAEWRDIQTVIPSLECRVRLTEDLGVEELIVDRECWRLLTAIDGRRSMRDLVRKTNRPVLEVCNAVVALVDADACQIVAPSEAPAVLRSTGGKAARAIA